jgi:hypothetical protein
MDEGDGRRLPREDVHGPCDDEPEDGDREHGRAGDRECARVPLGEAAAPPEARRHAPRPLRPAGPARPDEVRAAAPDHPDLGEGKRDPEQLHVTPGVGVDHFGVRPEPQTSIEPVFYGVGAVVLAVDVALLGGLAAIDKAKGWDIIDLPGGRGCCSRRLPCCSSSCCSRCRSPSRAPGACGISGPRVIGRRARSHRARARSSGISLGAAAIVHPPVSRPSS